MAQLDLKHFEEAKSKQMSRMAIEIPVLRRTLSFHVHAMNVGPPIRRKYITVWTPFLCLLFGLYFLFTTDSAQWSPSPGYVQHMVVNVTQNLLDIEESLSSKVVAQVPNNTEPKDYLIPRRIHQSWISNEVVHMSSMWIKTWLAHNPDYEYWFWTPAEAMPFLKKYYPEYLGLYESFRDSGESEDLLRYLVLHHYGGFFFDLDMKCLKPLDTWAFMYPCFVSKEPYEHIFLYDNSTTHTVASGLLVCRPGHPFLISAVKTMASLKKVNRLPPVNTTGSALLASVLKDYQASGKKLDSRDEVKLIPPKYFMSTYDDGQPRIKRQLEEKCSLPRYNATRLHYNEKAICKAYNRRRGDNTPSNDSYTNHFWLPLHGENSKRLYTVSIFKIVPGTKTFRNNGGTS